MTNSRARVRRPPLLEFVHEARRYTARNDDGVIASAASLDALLSSDESAAAACTRIGPRQELRIALKEKERAAVLGALRPDDVAAEQLAEGDDGQFTEFDENQDAIDVGNTIDGEPWCWYLTYLNDNDQDQWEWMIVPCGFGNATKTFVVKIMDGGAPSDISYGCQTLGDVSLCWWDGGELGASNWIAYGVSAAELFAGTINTMIYDGFAEEHRCPTCNEAVNQEEDDDWHDVTLELSDSIPDDAVAVALDRLWRPCPKHRNGAVLEVGVRSWHWDAKHWSPNSGS